MSDNKRNGRSFNGTGYYIALILCAAAIGISGYLYYRNENQVREVSHTPTEEMLWETVPEELTLPVMATQAPALPPVTEAPPRQVKEPIQTAAPIQGDAVMDFSMEALSYNETTRDWRVHNGMDLAAPEGTEVRAAAEGTVYTTYEDDSLGTTVVIRHQDGYLTRYSSLREDISVKAGDRVDLGQPIGYVGTSALTESVLGPHVHFSVSCRDVPMDPRDFLKLN